MTDDLKDSVLSIFEASLDAQLRAVRRLRHGVTAVPLHSRKGRSQVDMANDVRRKPTPPCTFPNCSHAFSPPLASPSIAKASSLPSPRKSPARTASSAPGRIPSACDRRPDDFAGSFPGYRRRLALRLPSVAHLETRRAAGSGLAGVLGWRCPSRIIWTNGGQDRSWGAEYFLHSRCEWQPQELFRPILQRALVYCPGRLVGVAVDDTRLRKTGRCIQQAFYQRDPLSPPFHVNLTLGLRFLQASLLVPMYSGPARVSTRGLPIRFEEVSRVKKPSRKAKPEAWQEYKEAIRQHNLSQSFVGMMGQLRQELDLAGGEKKILVLAGDGQFLQPYVLPRPAGSHRVDFPGTQGCGVVRANSARGPAFLRHGEIHSRAGAARRGSALEGDQSLLWGQAAINESLLP